MPLDQHFDTLTSTCDQMGMPVWIADPQRADCPLIHANPLCCDQAPVMTAVSQGRCCFFSEGAKGQDLPDSCIACRSSATVTTCRPGYRQDGSRVLTLLTVRPLYVRQGRFLVVGFQHDCWESTTRIGFDQYAKKISAFLSVIDGRAGYLRGSASDMDAVRLNVLLMRFNSAHARLKNVLLRSRFVVRPGAVSDEAPRDAAQPAFGTRADCFVAD